MERIKRPKAGQPRKEETATISARIPKALKTDLMQKYKGKINAMIADYLKSLIS